MASILIVDDEQSYRDELQVSLSGAGHVVMTACDGREAIEIGCRYRPDIVVADWMLTDHINGLAVADALRLVHPDIRVILITGYVSNDLEFDAAHKHVFEIVEKPFEVKRIRSAVTRALRDLPEQSYGTDLPVGVLEVDSTGTILWANSYAEELLGEAAVREDTGNIRDLFWGHSDEILKEADHDWVTVEPFGNRSDHWRIRASRHEDEVGRIYVILEEENRNYESFPAVQTLLELPQSLNVSWPADEHVLIIDSDLRSRRRVAGALREAGCCISHVAGSTEEGMRLLSKDPKVRLVVFGAGHTDSVGLAVRKLKGVRSDISVVECG